MKINADTELKNSQIASFYFTKINQKHLSTS